MALAALQHVESFWTRDLTHIPYIGRWILNHWTTREVCNVDQSLLNVTILLPFYVLVFWPQDMWDLSSQTRV